MVFERKRAGNEGEKAATEYLVGRGYKILATNFRSRWGEIDIIAEDGKVLVLVEVKTKQGSRWGNPEEMIRKSQLDRLKKTSWQFDDDGDRERRIDMVAISLNLYGEVVGLKHYEAVG